MQMVQIKPYDRNVGEELVLSGNEETDTRDKRHKNGMKRKEKQ